MICSWCGKTHIGKCEEQKTYTEQDDQWPSRRWNKEHTDHIDLGGPACSYCGEEPPTERIADPNLDMSSNIDWRDDKNWWRVCKDCKEVIQLQKQHSMAVVMDDTKTIFDISKKLDKISERTGKPILNASLEKTETGYKMSSIEHTKNGRKIRMG